MKYLTNVEEYFVNSQYQRIVFNVLSNTVIGSGKSPTKELRSERVEDTLFYCLLLGISWNYLELLGNIWNYLEIFGSTGIF